MPASLEAETFLPHRGTTFRVDVDGVAALLELTDVQVHGERPAPRARPFSLLFTGPATPALDQQIHLLEHPALGTLEIFLVPIGFTAGRRSYEAVFN